MLHVLRLLGATRLTRLPWRKRRHQETEANERLLETGGAACILSGFDLHGQIDALGSREEYVK